MTAGVLRVQLHCMGSGTRGRLDVSLESRVAGLRKKASRWSSIPIPCLYLFVDGDRKSSLGNEQRKLADVWKTYQNSRPDATLLPVSLVVSRGSWMLELQSDQPDRQIAAMNVSSELGMEIDSETVATLASCVRSLSGHVRCTAVEALARIAGYEGWCRRPERIRDALLEALLGPQDGASWLLPIQMAAKRLPYVAPKNDKVSMVVLAKCAASQEPSVRQAVTKSLCAIIELPDEVAYEVLIAMLECSEVGVRLTALEVLAQQDFELIPASIHGLASSQLADSESSVRQAAKEALKTAVAYHDKRGFDVLAPHLRNTNASLRCMALRFVVDAARKGNRPLQDAVIAHLSDPDEDVRWLALDALKTVSARGDPHVVVAVYSCLEHDVASVRQVAVEALLAVAEPDDPETLRIAAILLEDPHHEVRRSAAAVVVALAKKRRDELAFAEVYKRLEHPFDGARGAAVVALTFMATKGDLDHMAAVEARLMDSSSDVRGEAVLALQIVAPDGDPHIVETVASYLSYPASEVKVRALEILAKLPNKGDAAAISAVGASLADPDKEVRCAAVSTLANMADMGDKRVISAATSHLKLGSQSHEMRRAPSHHSADAKRSAIELLARMANKGDDNAIQAVGASLQQDPDFSVRNAAVKFLRDGCNRGDQFVVNVVSACAMLPHRVGSSKQEVEMRLNAIKCLASVADVGDRQAMIAIMECIRSPDTRVKCTAMDVLAALSHQGDKQSIAVLQECIDDPNVDNAAKAAAAKALSQIASHLSSGRATLSF